MLLLSQAESAQRRFLLTGSQADLDTYDSAQRKIASAISQLQKRTSDNRRQEQLLNEFRVLAAEMIAQLSSTLRETGARAAGVSPAMRDARERELNDAIHAIASTSLREEEALLQGRQATLATAMARRAVFIWIALGILAAASASALYFLRKLQRLEPIVQMCAWSKAIKDGDEWISFETYLQRRFNVRISHGISPAELDKIQDELAHQDR
jgi:CHASE3 domain sensor protein